MKWIRIEDEEPMQIGAVDLLVCDKFGNITIAERDEVGFSDLYSHPVYDVIAWMYLKDVPRPPLIGTITNDKWVELVAKQGFLHDH